MMQLGLGQLQIKESGSLQNAAFSPDGSKISFTRFRDSYNGGDSDVGIFDLSTGKVNYITKVLGDGAHVSQPGSCWADRGIIFSTDAFGPDRASLWNGADIKPLFKPQDAQTWEPSQCDKYYVAERHDARGKGPGQIILSNFATLDVVEPLTDKSQDNRQPCVSRDGRYVVYQRHNGMWSLFIRNMETGAETRLCYGTDATFSYDGKRLVFSGEGDENDGKLCTFNLFTNEIKRVAVETKYSGAPSFSPDGRFVAYEGGPSGEDDGPGTNIHIAAV